MMVGPCGERQHFVFCELHFGPVRLVRLFFGELNKSLSSGALEKVDIDFFVKERIGIHRISPLS